MQCNSSEGGDQATLVAHRLYSASSSVERGHIIDSSMQFLTETLETDDKRHADTHPSSWYVSLSHITF